MHKQKRLFPHFIHNLKELRKIIPLHQIPRILKISGRQYENWENGTSYPNIVVAARVARWCNTTIDGLLYHNVINVYKGSKKK